MTTTNYWQTPVLVTGLPRSGTSMVAGCFKELGAWLGDTVPGGVGNPKGFFENQRLREQLIKPLLQQLGCDPLGVKSLPDFQSVPTVNGLDRVFFQLLKQDGYGGDQPWLYKDAKMTLLWPLIAQVFPYARWVIVKRPAEDVISSCLRTHFMAHHSQNTLFWRDFVTQYQTRLDLLKQSEFQVYEIAADNLISGNSDEILTLARNLGLAVDAEAIRQFVVPGFWQVTSQTA